MIELTNAIVLTAALNLANSKGPRPTARLVGRSSDGYADVYSLSEPIKCCNGSVTPNIHYVRAQMHSKESRVVCSNSAGYVMCYDSQHYGASLQEALDSLGVDLCDS